MKIIRLRTITIVLSENTIILYFELFYFDNRETCNYNIQT